LLIASPRSSAAAPRLQDVLDNVGRQMEKFWNDFQFVTCTETVTQSKLGPKDKPLFVQHETFDYLIGLQAAGLDIVVDESRKPKDRSASKGDASLLETNGFSIFSLVFHPLYQSRYRFTQLPDETAENRRLLTVAFEQATPDHPLSVLLLRHEEHPLEWRGKAWIDPESWAVVRIQAGLGDSMEYLGLLSLDVDVTYTDVRFNDSTVFHLPSRASIEAATKRQHWLNTHSFTDYRRFAVATDVKVTSPQK
jgi:hypothetical protein